MTVTSRPRRRGLPRRGIWLRGIWLGGRTGPGMSEPMPGFTPPTSRVRLSFIGAMEEFRAEGRGAATDDTMLGREIREFGLDWQDPERFEAYTAYLRDQ